MARKGRRRRKKEKSQRVWGNVRQWEPRNPVYDTTRLGQMDFLIRDLCISEICLRRRSFFFFLFFFSRETREISFSNIFEFFNERLFVLSFFDLLEEGT